MKMNNYHTFHADKQWAHITSYEQINKIKNWYTIKIKCYQMLSIICWKVKMSL